MQTTTDVQTLVTGITVAGTLLGVIVGAIITKGFDYLLAVRREREEEKRGLNNRILELKAAARLIDEEFMRGEHAATFCISNGHWWPSNVKSTTKAWEENRGLIASDTTLGAWAAIMPGALAIADLTQKRMTSEGAPEKITPSFKDITPPKIAPPIDPEKITPPIEDITELLARILIARDALARLIGKLDDMYAKLIGVRSLNDPMVQADRRPLKKGADLK
jgi:hypothetical protein